MYKSILLLTLVLKCTIMEAQQSNDTIIVSTNGLYNNRGTIDNPINLKKALYKINKFIQSNSEGSINIFLKGGYYYLDTTILISTSSKNESKKIINISAFTNETAIISGARPLQSKWIKKKGNKNIWENKVISTSLPTQLFKNNLIVERVSSDELSTIGNSLIWKDKFKQFRPYRFVKIDSLRNIDLLPFMSFTSGDSNVLNRIKDTGNIEIKLFHSWDVSLHDIYSIKKINGVYEILLKTPSYYPVGFFADTTRFYIENSAYFLTKENLWYYDKKNRNIVYWSPKTLNPNNQLFSIPYLSNLMTIVGSGSNEDIKIVFKNITFAHTISPRGINVCLKQIRNQINKYPNIDTTTGYSGFQASAEIGQAVKIYRANNCLFDSCNFISLGNYGIQIDKYSNNNIVQNCKFNSLGGGGIIVGYNHSRPIEAGIPESASPMNNKVIKNVISNIGLYFPSSVAIAIMQAKKTLVDSNIISNTPYSGISCGWTWSGRQGYTDSNYITNNIIHDVMSLLADGGGIYTLGKQSGTVIEGNIIYNIKKHTKAIGANNNGIFFDERSSDMVIKNNKIFGIDNEPIRFNQTDSTKFKWYNNIFKK